MKPVQTALVVMTDDSRMGAMLAQSRKVADHVVALIAGSENLAQKAKGAGFDKVTAMLLDEGVAVESLASDAAKLAAEHAPQLILCAPTPAARIMLGSIGTALNACMLDYVVELETDNDGLAARCEIANGIAEEEYFPKLPCAGVFVGRDVEAPGGEAAYSVEIISQSPARVVETLPIEQTGLATASKVVGIGMGVKESQLELVKAFAAKINAELACTLPVCDDRGWLPPSRVLGSSHNQCAPDLYIALGISGSPNHLSGVRDAKVVVAVNNNPDASIFKRANYGIAADLADVLPALEEALS